MSRRRGTQHRRPDKGSHRAAHPVFHLIEFICHVCRSEAYVILLPDEPPPFGPWICLECHDRMVST